LEDGRGFSGVVSCDLVSFDGELVGFVFGESSIIFGFWVVIRLGGLYAAGFRIGEGILGRYAGMFSSVRMLICVVPQEKNCAKAISTARWRRRRR